MVSVMSTPATCFGRTQYHQTFKHMILRLKTKCTHTHTHTHIYILNFLYLTYGKAIKGKWKVHPRTGHEGPEGE